MKKIYAYSRESTAKQDDLYQITDVEKAIKNREDKAPLIHFFIEKLSGFDNDRPLMNELLNIIKSGKIDGKGIIYTYSFERLARDPIFLQTIIQTCVDHKVDIYFVSTNQHLLNTDNEVDITTQMLYSILGYQAKNEVYTMRKKSVAQKKVFAKLGRHVGSLLPLGYTHDAVTKQLMINNDEKKIVELIFNDYAEGSTLTSICNKLNALSVTDKSYSNLMTIRCLNQNYDKKYKHWNPSTISRILKNRWYIGERIYKDEVIKLDDSLKIISDELFERANKQQVKNKYSRNSKKHIYLLHKKCYCAHCNEIMRAKKGNKFQIYVCDKNMINMIDKNIKCPESKMTKIETLDNVIWSLIEKYVYEFKEKVVKNESKTSKISLKIDENQTIINNIKTKSIVDLNDRRKRTLKTFAKFGGDESDLKNEITEIDNEIKSLNNYIKDLESEIFNLKNQLDNVNVEDEIKNNIERIRNDKNLIKLYIDKLIDRIYFFGIKNEKLNMYKIVWNLGINNDSDTFIFYLGTRSINKEYYFISAIDSDSTTIFYNKMKHNFNIHNINKSDISTISVDDIINMFKYKNITDNIIDNNIFVGDEKINIIIPFE